MSYLLSRLPNTLPDLAVELRLNIEAVRARLHSARERGEAHIARWMSYGIGGHPQQVWDRGPGPDAPKPPKRTEKRRHADWRYSEIASGLLCQLENGPATIKALAAGVDTAENTAHRLLTDMIAAGVAHIHAWLPTIGVGGHPAMVVALGPGKNAKRARRQTKRETHARWVEKVRTQHGTEAARLMIRSRNHGGADYLRLSNGKIYQRRTAP